MSFLGLIVILKKALVELCLVIIQMMEVYGFFIFRECLIMMESLKIRAISPNSVNYYHYRSLSYTDCLVLKSVP